mmetsp:Transcript_4634/g.7124  ORF Transcript_4634/g.7124 Transcript_4634/m.7124 type:complete len:298 (+) Transcript_4634:90-983(+)|eukprot:jgi/Bigna1/85205/estExt_fgenesh1_pg.C_20419
MHSSSGPKRVRVVFSKQPPRIWYKDQAHEPKFFEVTVALKDEHGRRIRGMDVPLTPKLLYNNMSEVKRQTILKINKDSVPKIGKTGVAELKIRIDSVSKNHDNHDFIVNIAPEPGVVPPGVVFESAKSQPITVRSKRNRGKRKKEGAIDAESLSAIASWCRFNAGMLEELYRRETCPCCEYMMNSHAQSCKLKTSIQAYRNIVQRLIPGSKMAGVSKRAKTEDYHFPPTPQHTRLPSTELKRNRSPALALDQIHTLIPSVPNSSVQMSDDLFSTMGSSVPSVPPLLRNPSLTRKKSG